MKVKEAIANLGCRIIQGEALDYEIQGVDLDSRAVGASDMFVCVKGFTVDGHDYAKSAYDKGCRVFLCQREIEMPDDAMVIVSKDAKKDMALISAEVFGHPSKKLTLIGVTGTKGKTSTAIMIRTILQKSGFKTAYMGTNGLHINETVTKMNATTTPESSEVQRILAECVEAGVTHVVIEVSSLGVSCDRIYGLEFDTCVFTNLSPDHISEKEHDSYESYRDAKKMLFTSFGCKNAVYNVDDAEGSYMVEGAPVKKLSYSIKDPKASYYGDEFVSVMADDAFAISFTCNHDGVKTPVKMCSPGHVSMLNGLAAIAVAEQYGISATEASKILATVSVEGRFEIIKVLPGRVVVIDFAHNIISLTNALKALKEFNPNRLICVYGSVGNRVTVRRKGMGRAAASIADISIITSDNPDCEPPEIICKEIASYYEESEPYEIVVDRYEAIKRAMEISEKGDIILIAGKGNEDFSLEGGKRLYYSEKENIIRASKELEGKIK